MSDLVLALILTTACGFWALGVFDAATPRPDSQDATRWTWTLVCGLGGPLGAICWALGPRRRLPALERVDFWVPAEDDPALAGEDVTPQAALWSAPGHAKI